MNTVVKMANKSKTSTSEWCEDVSLTRIEEFGRSSSEELDIERQFCVDLPVHTFEDFWKLEEELESNSTKRKALIFFYGGYWTFLPALEILSTFPDMKLVINKERASGAYRLSALYCALMTSDLPNTFLHPVIMYILFFWVGGFGGIQQFFSSLAIYLLHTWACYGLGLFISALFHDLRMAITALFSYLISMYLLGGFFSQNIPTWIAWIKYLSIFFYPYSSAIIIISEQIPDTLCNETSVVIFPQCADNSTLFVTSDDVLQKANVVFPLYFYILIIVFYTIALRIAAYVVLRYRRSKPV